MRRSISSIVITLIVGITLLASARIAVACSRPTPVVVSQTCLTADLIVRAIAVRYSKEAKYENIGSRRVRQSTIEFKVEEVLNGSDVPQQIILHGYLTDMDDYNDRPVPYDFVRPGGRSGNCFAETYKKDAQFLLFLKQTATGLTVYFDPLAPVNEQLHSSNDPWVFYSKGMLRGLEGASKSKSKK